jgi:hypothetical protein
VTTSMTVQELGTALERLRFFPRQMIGAEDMRLEQDYFRQKLRRHNRFLHGWGVTCGCQVLPAPEAQKPWQVRICPGYLLTPQGDEILIGVEALFDLATCFLQSADPCAFAQPCPPVAKALKAEQHTIYLAVRYLECQSRPVRVAPAGCVCDDAQCEFSRTRDAYELGCLDTLPTTHKPSGITCEQLCQGGVFPCPACPDDPWVVLATVVTPAAASTPLQPGDISLADRHLLYSTAMVQQLALCACPTPTPTPSPSPSPSPSPTPPPTVATPVITPATGEQFSIVSVTISDATPGAIIFYTTDGTQPTAASSRYTGPFNVQGPLSPAKVTVMAKGILAGWNDSAVATATYWFTGQ